MLSLKVCNWLLEQRSVLSQGGGKRRAIRARVSDGSRRLDHRDKKNANFTFFFMEN